MIGAGAVPDMLYVRDTVEDLHVLDSIDVECPVRLVTPDVLTSLSDVPHPQGIVAVVPNSEVSSSPRLDVWDRAFILIVDGVRDPGNLGTLLRSAAGAGVSEVIVTPNTVDPFNPKCVRSAMGAHFLVSIRPMAPADLVSHLGSIDVIALADAEGDLSYDDVPWSESCAIIVGSEAFGPNDAFREIATAYVRIPLARNLESLNAGVAGSHLVLEAARQRRLAASQ
jgi:TrmH family RNA methyltransferase